MLVFKIEVLFFFLRQKKQICVCIFRPLSFILLLFKKNIVLGDPAYSLLGQKMFFFILFRF